MSNLIRAFETGFQDVMADPSRNGIAPKAPIVGQFYGDRIFGATEDDARALGRRAAATIREMTAAEPRFAYRPACTPDVGMGWLHLGNVCGFALMLGAARTALQSGMRIVSEIGEGDRAGSGREASEQPKDVPIMSPAL